MRRVALAFAFSLLVPNLWIHYPYWVKERFYLGNGLLFYYECFNHSVFY